MRNLLFENPIQRDDYGEPNVTVRKGLKWAETKVGEVLSVQQTDGTSELGRATVLGVLIGKMNAIPLCVLKLEHDPTCQTRDGLHRAMEHAYGSLPETELVTVLFYEFHGVGG